MKIVNKIPNKMLRQILNGLWDIEDSYYLTTGKVSVYFYHKLKSLIGYFEEEAYRRNAINRKRG